jgi:hypothetical protein
MSLELVIRYLGYGERCSNCGRVRETTRYTLRQQEDQLEQFKLCDACQDRGFVIRFNAKPIRVDQTKDRKRRIKISRKLEKGVAEDLGGQITLGSGNRDTKADVRKVDEWRIEHKYTDKLSFTLLISDLAAVIRHANRAAEWPAMVLNFRKAKRKFAIIPYELFLEIVEKIRG